MERLEVKFDADTVNTESGEIEGYAAVFGNVDDGGDIVAKGAFAKSLASGRRVAMLYMHNLDDPVGTWTELAEDDRGLRVKGRILTSIASGREKLEMVKAGLIGGLSIGYRTIVSERLGGARLLKELSLWEVSLVTFPMNELARIDAVKAADLTERDMERLLTQDAGLSRSVARKLMAGGFDAIGAKQDAGDGIAELAQFMRGTIA